MSNPIQSATVVEMAQGEVILCTANYGPQLYGDTIATVIGVTQKSGDSTLTFGTPAINTAGAITVDGQSRAINTCVQFTITTPSDCTAGDYVATCAITTTDGNTRKLDCLVQVFE